MISSHAQAQDAMYIYSCLQIAIDIAKARFPNAQTVQGSKLHNVPHRSYKDTLPPLRGRVLQWVQIERPHARQQIHLVCPDEEAALVLAVNFPENIKRNDDRRSEIFLEKSSGAGRATDGL